MMRNESQGHWIVDSSWSRSPSPPGLPGGEGVICPPLPPGRLTGVGFSRPRLNPMVSRELARHRGPLTTEGGEPFFVAEEHRDASPRTTLRLDRRRHHGFPP